ncbi:hypothetical protein PRUB_a3455 [Pseudoalteromonas rubra]|uniref:Uncharacterized protein n=1 Tax=Pseudoalteromonas rubra TaxID=43658 RepID=A0A8T0C2P1_9GAMM|nr:hypothetical protein [Pseudoalteromonas rubra]KAF7783629.1 hypothetical protein PRUB_a3455 [Pseudoalteromonas rubra]
MQPMTTNHLQLTAIVWLVALLCLINMGLILAFTPFVIFKISATFLAVGVTELAMVMTRRSIKSKRLAAYFSV